jgi:type I restriction enzyme R subunit
MSTPLALPLRFFDAEDEHFVIERRLPHWTQPGTVAFITWRTWDSIPASVVETWHAERPRWLLVHGIDGSRADWQAHVARLPAALRREFKQLVFGQWDTSLDRCHGECLLRRPELAAVVANSLKHFDGDRYLLTDFVVMPNHVHLLAAFPDEQAMLTQVESWKHFMAVQINKRLGRKRRVWQVDGFDHLVRSEEQFGYLRDYIEQNPEHANLVAGEYVHYRRELAK